MALTVDPVFAEVVGNQARLAAMVGVTAPERGDALGLRAFLQAGFPMTFNQAEPAPGVTYRTFEARAEDGTPIALRWYTKAGSAPGSAVVFIHGGGMVAGTVEFFDPAVRQYVHWTGVPFLSVEYRLAPEVTGDVPARDAATSLAWLAGHAGELGVDPARIAIMGESGGGGVAAGAAILARDRGLRVAGQILISPMLDDRNTEPDAHLAPTTTWTYDNNFTAWHALLSDDLGTECVSRYASPARNTEFEGLAPAYIEVGTLDIFRDECIAYAQSLLAAGVDAELHVHQGAPHGHDWLAFNAPLADRWKADRIRVITQVLPIAQVLPIEESWKFRNYILRRTACTTRTSRSVPARVSHPSTVP